MDNNNINNHVVIDSDIISDISDCISDISDCLSDISDYISDISDDELEIYSTTDNLEISYIDNDNDMINDMINNKIDDDNKINNICNLKYELNWLINNGYIPEFLYRDDITNEYINYISRYIYKQYIYRKLYGNNIQKKAKSNTNYDTLQNNYSKLRFCISASDLDNDDLFLYNSCNIEV